MQYNKHAAIQVIGIEFFVDEVDDNIAGLCQGDKVDQIPDIVGEIHHGVAHHYFHLAMADGGDQPSQSGGFRGHGIITVKVDVGSYQVPCSSGSLATRKHKKAPSKLCRTNKNSYAASSAKWRTMPSIKKSTQGIATLFPRAL